MYYFKTQGREYRFRLNEEDGLVHCDELKLKAPTVAELKPLVTAVIKEEKSIPRIPVIIFDGRWIKKDNILYGSASGKTDAKGHRWVSYTDERGTKRRGRFGDGALYLDTPENRASVESITYKQEQVESIENSIEELKRRMTRIGSEEKKDTILVRVSV